MTDHGGSVGSQPGEDPSDYSKALPACLPAYLPTYRGMARPCSPTHPIPSHPIPCHSAPCYDELHERKKLQRSSHPSTTCSAYLFHGADRRRKSSSWTGRRCHLPTGRHPCCCRLPRALGEGKRAAGGTPRRGRILPHRCIQYISQLVAWEENSWRIG